MSLHRLINLMTCRCVYLACGYLIFIITFTTGCSVSSQVTYNDLEGEISEAFFHDIRRNKTRKDWVVSQLGEPLDMIVGPNEQQLYTYELVKSEAQHTSLLAVLKYKGEQLEREYFHVLFAEDLVKKHWRDRHQEVDAERYFKMPKRGRKANVSYFGTATSESSTRAVSQDTLEKSSDTLPAEIKSSVNVEPIATPIKYYPVPVVDAVALDPLESSPTATDTTPLNSSSADEEQRDPESLDGETPTTNLNSSEH
ncbi:hypothetical protein [Teredinibacter waterburyi]|uniref:hypothetical protein n=1 Tax=Teredinibacter waterburyi TaxID=1500538 RepID=UPI00165F2C6D|nr:hypothetical protein [Teredinibacter waterburyi]